MEIKTITADLSVSGQITLEDLPRLQSMGIKSIICNRPDHEEPNQLRFETIAEAAKELGIHSSFMPVISGRINAENVDEFASTTTSLPKPIHAYCRSGTRCSTLWALAELSKKGKDRDAIIQHLLPLGYDLSKAI